MITFPRQCITGRPCALAILMKFCVVEPGFVGAFPSAQFEYYRPVPV